MARTLSPRSIQILESVEQKKEISLKELYTTFQDILTYKEYSNNLFRLTDQGLLHKEKMLGVATLTITEEGKKTISRRKPTKDGVWKIVIFDIPEKDKYVRTVLRAKLSSLSFKKWQNSIWISPFALDEEVENELRELSEKFFIRLIKTTDINNTQDLNKMFEKI